MDLAPESPLHTQKCQTGLDQDRLSDRGLLSWSSLQISRIPIEDFTPSSQRIHSLSPFESFESWIFKTKLRHKWHKNNPLSSLGQDIPNLYHRSSFSLAFCSLALFDTVPGTLKYTGVSDFSKVFVSRSSTNYSSCSQAFSWQVSQSTP